MPRTNWSVAVQQFEIDELHRQSWFYVTFKQEKWKLLQGQTLKAHEQ
jgi:hypothetical protein